jgi:hypothetical protein
VKTVNVDAQTEFCVCLGATFLMTCHRTQGFSLLIVPENMVIFVISACE